MRLLSHRALWSAAALPVLLGLTCLNPGPQIIGKTVDWQLRTVNSVANVRPSAVQIADFDGDSLPDIAVAYEGLSPSPPAVIIFFQTDEDNWSGVQIGSGAELTGVAALTIGDVDADGHSDVIAACNGRLLYLHSPADPRQEAGWTASTIANSDDSGVGQWSDVIVGSIDGVNGIDIVASNSTKGWLSWFVNPSNAANGTGWTRVHIDATSRAGADGVAIDDVDSDGRNDVLSTAPTESSARVAWYKNPTNPAATAWTKYTIGNMGAATRVVPGDLNVDGRNDAVAVNSLGHQVGWYVHPSTATSTWSGYEITEFTLPTSSVPEPVDVKVAFVDNNAQPDLVVACNTPGRLRWFVKVGDRANSQTYPWGENNIRDFTQNLGRIAVGDINHDGRPDVVAPLRAITGAADSIVWLENPE
jgi:hypothetical protein